MGIAGCQIGKLRLVGPIGGGLGLSIEDVEMANGWPEGRFTHTNISLTSKVVYEYLCPYFKTGRLRLPFLIKNHTIWNNRAHTPGWQQSCGGSSSCSLRCHPAVPILSHMSQLSPQLPYLCPSLAHPNPTLGAS